MHRLLFADDLVAYCMCGSSQQGLQHAFDRFSAACDQAGTKISSKIEVLLYVSLRRPRQCFLQVSGNTLQQEEGLKYIGVVFTSDEKSEQRNCDTAGEANAVLRELYSSMVTKWEFS